MIFWQHTQWNKKHSVKWTHENDNILRTLGAAGMSMNKELEKKEMRLLASKFEGTSIADSLTVSNKYNLLIWEGKMKMSIKNRK